MPDGIRLDLVLQLRRLLMAAGWDEQGATAAFHALVDAHGKTDVGLALAIVAAEYFASERAEVSASDYPGKSIRMAS
jgi:hypothetical protein